MDFGPVPEIKKNRNFKKNVLALVAALVVLGVATGVLFYLNNASNPLPSDIKNQLSYKAVYPPSGLGTIIDSYQYNQNDRVLTFSLRKFDTKIVFVEQKAPESLGANGQVYFPAIGIHPYAQFQSKIGPAALTKFYKSGNLEQFSQSGVLYSEGTLVWVGSQKNLTNDQWKTLFDGLKVSK